MPFGNLNVDTVTTSTAGGILGAGNASIMKNRVTNGSMVIDQRNAGAASANTISGYFLDRWIVGQSTTGKLIAQQNAGSVTPPVGFSNYLGVTSQSAFSVGTSELYYIQQGIEGFNTADLGWGTANAKTVTLSFWVRSSLTGTFGGTFYNNAIDRLYPYSYTISAANTWEYKTVTIAGDTTGTWLTNNGAGAWVFFSLGAGSSLSGTAGAWVGGSNVAGPYSSTGATSVVGTSGATFYITGVQLEVGSSATGFEYRLYNQELLACQRYFEAGSLWREGTNAGSGNFCVFSESFLVQKRTDATFIYGNVGGANSGVASVQGPEAIYEWITPFAQTNARTGFAFRFTTNNATSTIRQYWLASAEL